MVKGRVKFSCPCCGMVSDISRLRNAPYRIRIFQQFLGGKVAGVAKGRGKAPGAMKYVNITGKSSRDMREVRATVERVYGNMD